ncbi:MAG TPA: nucleotidyl transferase AbiEii/AbiGii toxin family protein, partial [Herpetosiphonaceae bacterium]
MTKPLPPALTAWLRRAREPLFQHPVRPHLLLSGSALLATLCPSARTPQDLDYVWGGRFDDGVTDEVLGAAKALLVDAAPLSLLEDEVIVDYDTDFPGVRLFVSFEPDETDIEEFTVDFTFNDPLTQEPRLVDVPGVGPTLAVAPESLFAWKVHALVQFGWNWRPKDLYDLKVLWAEGGLDRSALPAAIDVAFSSRGSALDELDEFRFNEEWGVAQGRDRYWSMFLRQAQVEADFLEVRAEIRAMLDELLAP